MWSGRLQRIGRTIARLWRRDTTLVDLLIDGIGGMGDAEIEGLRRAAKSSPKAALACVRALIAAHRESDAARVLADASVRFPGHDELEKEHHHVMRIRWADVHRAYRLYHEGDFCGARAAFVAASQMIGARVPMEAVATVNAGIGWCDLESGQYSSALEHFERAARAQPDVLDGPFGAGLALRALLRERDARIRLARAVAINPLSPGPAAFIGWIHYESGRLAPAERAFKNALERNPFDVEAPWGIAWTAWKRRDYASARAAFLIALERGRHRSMSDLVGISDGYPEWIPVLAAVVSRTLSTGEIAIAESAARARCRMDPVGGALPMAQVFLAAGRPLDVLLPWPYEDEGTTRELAESRLRAALMLGDLESAKVLLESPYPIDPAVRAAAHEARGEIDEAVAILEAVVAEGRDELRGELERQKRRRARRSIEKFSDLSSRNDPLLANDLSRALSVARRLHASGQKSAAREILQEIADPRADELFEEMFPIERPTTARGYLSAVLAGLSPQRPLVRDEIVELTDRLTQRPVSRRSAELWLRRHSADPEDDLVARATRRVLEDR